MRNEVEKREEVFDRLLPKPRFKSRPGPELLNAANRWSEAIWVAAEKAGSYPINQRDWLDALSLATRPVFICGVHRSGTTLIRNLLDGHSELSVLPSEGSFLTSLQAKLKVLGQAEKLRFFGYEWLRRFAISSGQAPYWILGRTTSQYSPYVLFSRMLMTWWPVLENSLEITTSLWPHIAVILAYTSCIATPGIDSEIKRWVDKTPTNEFFLDQLWAELPDAKVIHVIRDPVAVFASRKGLELKMLGSFKAPRRVIQNLTHSYKIAAENQLRTDQRKYIIVRYEELIQKPEKVMAGIASFLDIEFTHSLIRPTVAGIPAYSNSSFFSSEKPGSILSGTVDRSYEMLTESEYQLVAAYTAKFSRALGYHVTTPEVGQRVLAKLQFGVQFWMRHLKREVYRKMRR